MTTQTRDRFLGLTLVALLVTIGGDLLGMTLLVALGVTSFFLAVVGLFALMTVTLVVGVTQRPGTATYDTVPTDGARSPTPPPER